MNAKLTILLSINWIDKSSSDLNSIESLYIRSLELINQHEIINDGPVYESLSNRNSGQSGVSLLGVSMDFEHLQEYGCWCYFDDLHGEGHGIAQDGYDDACLALHHGTACAMMEIENCDPRTEVTRAELVMTAGGNIEYRMMNDENLLELIFSFD